MFPAYLREAGYYATNNAKKDYNVVEGPGVWDESSRKASWRSRPSAKSRSSTMSTGLSHESSAALPVEGDERPGDADRPETVAIAPYHPDTPTVPLHLCPVPRPHGGHRRFGRST